MGVGDVWDTLRSAAMTSERPSVHRRGSTKQNKGSPARWLFLIAMIKKNLNFYIGRESFVWNNYCYCDTGDT